MQSPDEFYQEGTASGVNTPIDMGAPMHHVQIVNDGATAIRVNTKGTVATSTSPKIKPGETLELGPLSDRNGRRYLGILADSGAPDFRVFGFR